MAWRPIEDHSGLRSPCNSSPWGLNSRTTCSERFFGLEMSVDDLASPISRRASIELNKGTNSRLGIKGEATKSDEGSNEALQVRGDLA